ncbi:SHOCT domain-containing protein [uncultured Microscilla sp.]|uniref:SHOCT domain-containing protein n=1 Tax=uncultured Microscilla sp. TaxID=432653 RepID=UPI002615A28A|nr:SHOCT domain-containing protein [uncultured Microscilla sp.]
MADKSTQADRVIDNHILWSMGAGALPIPIVDVAAVTAIQLNMLKELCLIYDVDYSEGFGKNLISSIVGAGVAKVGASAVKTIPVVGALLGGVPMVVLSGASTYALGQVFKSQLQVTNVLSKFDMSGAKEMYKDAFEKGKQYVKDLRDRVGFGEKPSTPEADGKEDSKNNSDNGADSKQTTGDDAVFEKLRILGDLRDKGILTEDEFQQKKQKILAQL